MRILLISLCIIIVDQVTKLLVKGISIPILGIHIEGWELGNSRPIVGDFLRLNYIENPGMAFGIDINGQVFLSLFSIAASIAIIVYLYHVRAEHFAFRFSLSLILGGALGNLIDRVFYGVLYGEAPLFYGRVVDFIDCDFFDIDILGFQLTRWPVFNVADASITCGIILFLLVHRKTIQKKAPASQPEQQSTETNPPNL